MAGISKLISTIINNIILQTMDGSDFKTVEYYQPHEIIKAITDGAGKPKATTIRNFYVAMVGIHFDFRERTNANVKRFNVEAEKSTKFGVKVHDILKVTVIIGNIEWAAQQPRGSEIDRAQRKINMAYQYNHAHDASSIKDILKIMNAVDNTRDRCQKNTPEEMEEAVSQGMTRLQHMVNNPPKTELNSDCSYGPSQYELAYVSESNVLPERGAEKLRRKRRIKNDTAPLPHPPCLPRRLKIAARRIAKIRRRPSEIRRNQRSRRRNR